MCAFCGGEIARWKAKNISTCSVRCKFELRNKRSEDQRQEQKYLKKNGGSLVHSCLSNENDPYDKSQCYCRKLVSDVEGARLVKQSEAVHFVSRRPEFIAGDPLLLIGQRMRAPRAATIEKAHIERAVSFAPPKLSAKDIDIEKAKRLQDAIERDRIEKAEEENVRMEIYHDLTVAAQRKWIREVSAGEYDTIEHEQRGRVTFTTTRDERTAGGIGIWVDLLTHEPIDRDSAVRINLIRQQQQDEQSEESEDNAGT